MLLKRTYYVDASASAGGDGLSFDRPFNSIHLVPFEFGYHTTIRVAAGTETMTTQFVVPANTDIIGQRGTIFDGGDADLYGIFRLEDPTSVTIQDITLQRARHGLLIMGTAQDCLIERVTCQDMYGLGGFAHEDTSLAEGRVVFKDCKAIRCEGDGYSNRGNADDLLIDCQAIHCGPVWGVRELDFKVAELKKHSDPRLRKIHEQINYQSISTSGHRPTTLRQVYVDSVNGDDSNDGLSANSAWQTMDKVETTSVAGDCINVACGSSFTGTTDAATLTLKSNQTLRPYGSGARPFWQTFNNEAIIVPDGATKVWIEGLDFKDCGPGVLVTGDVTKVWIYDCIFNQSETFGVQANDASGSGDINIFKCTFYWNNDGSVHATAGSYVINAWDCKGTDNARDIGTTAAAAWLAAGSCSMNLHGVWEDDPYYRGFALGGSGNHTIDGCWVNDPQDNAGVTVRKGIEVSSSGTTTIYNTVIGIADPGSGETTIGLHVTDGTVKVFNNTFQDTRDSGGNGSSSITIDSGAADSVVLRNNLFDAENGNAGTVYVTLDITETGVFDIDYNAYHDWSGAGTLNGWYDSDAGAAIAVAAWVAVDGNTEDVGSTGVLLTNQATTNLPATTRASDARIDDLNTTAIYKGQDLAAAELVTWTTDAGFRERNRNPEDGWTIGAWENSTGSPDGATTHADSGMRLERFDAVWCQNGIDFTHDHVTTDEECGVFDSIFFECYDGAVETAFTRPFPFKDCRFIGGIGPAIDINPPSGASGDEWFIEGCEFVGVAADGMVKLRSSAAITVNVSSCVFWGPESSYAPVPTVTFGQLLELGSGAVAAKVDNCSFWLPTGRNNLNIMYCIRAQSGATGASDIHNCTFYARDDSYSRYIRGDNAARFGAVDTNFYWLASSNLTNFRAGGSDVNFAAWKSAISDDAGAWESSDKVDSRPVIGEWRYPSAEAFRMNPYAAQAGAGTVRAANSRAAMRGALRPSAAAWDIGPFAGRVTKETIFRSPDCVTFADFALAARYFEDISLGEFESNTAMRLQMANEAGADLEVKVHVGRLAEGNIVWEGLLASTKETLTAEFLAPKGDLYVSFGGNSGTIHGSVAWRDLQGQQVRRYAGAGEDPYGRLDLMPSREV